MSTTAAPEKRPLTRAERIIRDRYRDERLDGWALDLIRQHTPDLLVGVTLDDSWQQTYRELLAYVEEYGTANPKQRYRTPAGFPLGKRVNALRVRYHDERLDPDRIEALEALPGWTWDAQADAFERTIAAIIAYVDANGHADVPATHFTDGGFPLGQRVQDLRKHYKNKRLDPDRKLRLEAIKGWFWDTSDLLFDQLVDALIAYAAEYGTPDPSRNYVSPGGFPLGSRLADTRTRHRLGKVPRERGRRLEAIPGFWWDKPRRTAGADRT